MEMSERMSMALPDSQLTLTSSSHTVQYGKLDPNVLNKKLCSLQNIQILNLKLQTVPFIVQKGKHLSPKLIAFAELSLCGHDTNCP